MEKKRVAATYTKVSFLVCSWLKYSSRSRWALAFVYIQVMYNVSYTFFHFGIWIISGIEFILFLTSIIYTKVKIMFWLKSIVMFILLQCSLMWKNKLVNTQNTVVICTWELDGLSCLVFLNSLGFEEFILPLCLENVESLMVIIILILFIIFQMLHLFLCKI